MVKQAAARIRLLLFLAVSVGTMSLSAGIIKVTVVTSTRKAKYPGDASLVVTEASGWSWSIIRQGG
ncbi:MAG: hypothetical protein ACUVXJ_14895, partial [Phycisphaerae bacterium]